MAKEDVVDFLEQALAAQGLRACQVFCVSGLF